MARRSRLKDEAAWRKVGRLAIKDAIRAAKSIDKIPWDEFVAGVEEGCEAACAAEKWRDGTNNETRWRRCQGLARAALHPEEPTNGD